MAQNTLAWALVQSKRDRLRKRVDLALFSKLPRMGPNLAVAVEVKKRNLSCLSARSQAEAYAERPGREACNRLIVTDGIRYGIYVRGSDRASPSLPTGYLDLKRFMAQYPILQCAGSAEALRLMAPDWSGELPLRLEPGPRE